MQKHRLLEQAFPSLFPFSLPPLPPLFVPTTQAMLTLRISLSLFISVHISDQTLGVKISL